MHSSSPNTSTFSSTSSGSGSSNELASSTPPGPNITRPLLCFDRTDEATEYLSSRRSETEEERIAALERIAATRDARRSRMEAQQKEAEERFARKLAERCLGHQQKEKFESGREQHKFTPAKYSALPSVKNVAAEIPSEKNRSGDALPKLSRLQQIKLDAANEKAERDAARKLKYEAEAVARAEDRQKKVEEMQKARDIAVDLYLRTESLLKVKEQLGGSSSGVNIPGGYAEETGDTSPNRCATSFGKYLGFEDQDTLEDPTPIETSIQYLSQLKRWQEGLRNFNDGQDHTEYSHHVGFKKDYLGIHNAEGMIKNYPRTDSFLVSTSGHSPSSCFHCHNWNTVRWDYITEEGIWPKAEMPESYSRQRMVAELHKVQREFAFPTKAEVGESIGVMDGYEFDRSRSIGGLIMGDVACVPVIGDTSEDSFRKVLAVDIKMEGDIGSTVSFELDKESKECSVHNLSGVVGDFTTGAEGTEPMNMCPDRLDTADMDLGSTLNTVTTADVVEMGSPVTLHEDTIPRKQTDTSSPPPLLPLPHEDNKRPAISVAKYEKGPDTVLSISNGKSKCTWGVRRWGLKGGLCKGTKSAVKRWGKTIKGFLLSTERRKKISVSGD